jgi:hypothetical protein
MAEKPNEKEITVDFIPSLEPKLGKVYVNFAQVSHSPWDFTIKFCIAPPGVDIPRLHKSGEKYIELPNIVELIVGPDFVPLIIAALQENYDKFIKTYKVKQDEPTH